MNRLSIDMQYRSIKEFGKVVTGKTPSTKIEEYWNGEIPFLTPSDYSDGDRYVDVTERFLSNKGVESQSKTLIPKDSVCVTCIGSTVGKSCMTSKDTVTNQQINSIVCNEQNDAHYVFYLMQYCLPFLQMYGGGTGSGLPIISKGKFEKIKLLVFNDKKIQEKIANILCQYDHAIENNNKRIKILEQMAENLYKEWFVRFRFPGHEDIEFEGGIPKGWEIRCLADVYNTSSGGTPSRSNSVYYMGNIPWVKTGELLGSYILDTEEHISNEAVEKSSAKLFPPNSLLVAMYAGANVGNVGLTTFEGTCNQACCIINTKSNYSIDYLFQFIKTQKNYLQSISFGAAQQNISQEIIKRLKILLPPIDLLNRYDRLILPINESIKNYMSANRILIKQRDLLLPRLMSGKLEVK